jgi:spore germination cell wall hydrolase CwlJ-like protein
MSIIHRVFAVLVALSALTFNSVSHAETPDTKEGQQYVVASVTDRLQTITNAVTNPIIDPKELACLARNIFFEAGAEPIEGKVAVGVVTLNRVQDGRFGRGVCGVVDQRMTTSVTRTVYKETTVKTLFKTEVKREPVTVVENRTVCQFSWRCSLVIQPKQNDQRWIESQLVARELLGDQSAYSDYRYKYGEAKWFHNLFVKPIWSKQKQHVAKIGGHHFYAER